jgi:hypothetical protein
VEQVEEPICAFESPDDDIDDTLALESFDHALSLGMNEWDTMSSLLASQSPDSTHLVLSALLLCNRRTQKVVTRLSPAVRRRSASDRVDIKGSGGEGDPIHTEDMTVLNWSWSEAYETFKLLRRDLGARRRPGAFKKTAHKPYDEVDTAILIRATQLFGNEYILSVRGRGKRTSGSCNSCQWRNSGVDEMLEVDVTSQK